MDTDERYTYPATVINVVDGDTVDARLERTIDIGFHQVYTVTFAVRLRLLGVNCPEVHGATKAAGRAAADFTRSALLDRRVVVRSEKGDSFGRWLAFVTVDGESFNQRLIDAGHAVPFMTAGKALLVTDAG